MPVALIIAGVVIGLLYTISNLVGRGRDVRGGNTYDGADDEHD